MAILQNREKKVNRQVRLPFKKSLEIAVKSIKARFFRSLITLLSLVLAVAFLSYVRVSTDVANGMLTSKDPNLRHALVKKGYDVGQQDNRVNSGPKERWIIVLSLLVAVVGIINAQLMAVTERFREIGAMKCLGALDRFVVRLFILEAGIQGGIGAVAGSLGGAFFAITGALLMYGTRAVVFLNWVDVLESLAFALIVGLLLSIIGVLYPAIVAARMQPVVAMRAEL